MAKMPPFGFDDAGSFGENLSAYSTALEQLDLALGSTLSSALPALAARKKDRALLLNELMTAASTPAVENAVKKALPTTPSAPSPAATTTAHRWYLEAIEIEGFRGINNEKSPLILKFKTDCVNSISAPNAVGKSSIFDAVSFALTGGIEKLDKLLQAERGREYYVNRFHPAGRGTVKLTLQPDSLGKSVEITVTITSAGVRTVSGPAGVDAESLLAELNREFVLLDSQTFHNFIDLKALDRGRMFSGLLGLDRYSVLRQELQALTNTKSFNSHFNTTGQAATKTALEGKIKTTKSAIAADFENLVKEPLEPTVMTKDAQARCHAALSGSPVLIDHCASQEFMELNVDTCIEAIKSAEGGSKRARFAEVIQELDKWSKADRTLPGETDIPMLAAAVTAREHALAATRRRPLESALSAKREGLGRGELAVSKPLSNL